MPKLASLGMPAKNTKSKEVKIENENITEYFLFIDSEGASYMCIPNLQLENEVRNIVPASLMKTYMPVDKNNELQYPH